MFDDVASWIFDNVGSERYCELSLQFERSGIFHSMNGSVIGLLAKMKTTSPRVLYNISITLA